MEHYNTNDDQAFSRCLMKTSKKQKPKPASMKNSSLQVPIITSLYIFMFDFVVASTGTWEKKMDSTATNNFD